MNTTNDAPFAHIKRGPDTSGPIDLTGPNGGEAHASLGSHIMNLPWAHPVWSHYQMNIIHLRDLPGYGPAYKHFPEATHEFSIIALDPSDNKTWLEPVNFSMQIGYPGTQEEADKLAVRFYDSARIAFEGKFLNPDTDFISHTANALEQMALAQGATKAQTMWKTGAEPDAKSPEVDALAKRYTGKSETETSTEAKGGE